ncbi:hypothetical protein LV89_00980 [Arcicella aurantiaca]|uniref:Uncharacterized protein n=1 Tax=Arcicella aurantiaca TaxID=591202 RepID=A0A316ECJ9_9BACT|nr:hypothetical protein [Arcicella aurantiaca]PWK28201.1 hypothetical protein LV89_00980 [Arcicella aurantiaca]
MTLYEYFQSTNNYFWQWEYDADSEGFNVIGIPEGNTIVYKDMVIDIMDKLSHQGTPPFGVLLLLLIATNPNGEEDIKRIDRKLTDYLIYSQNTKNTNIVSTVLSMATQFLYLITQLPKEYKIGANRILLFQTLLQKSHNKLGYQKIRPIVKAMQSKSYSEVELLKVIEFNESIFLKDFRIVSLLKKHFDNVDDIMSKMGDLLPIEEELLTENTDTDEIPKLDFVEELIENTNTFHVGTLLKRIWSGLNVPFHNVLPSQQPIGGVSDLTNKGNFDRLLISEFANDDIVFLSRIANNEALYINREVPPQSEDLERIILIDVSIKNWGTPKLLAHALLLAIAKHPKSSIHCTAYAVGETYQPLNFDTIHEIIKGVQYLEGCLEASNGLTAFFNDNPANKNNEIFFITTTDAVKSAAVQKVLSDNHSAINYWIYTDAEGKIDLFKRQHSSRKHIQTLKLPLEELWTKKPKNDIMKVPEKVENKPTFYNILFPKQRKVRFSLSTTNSKVYHIAHDCLFEERDSEYLNRGWELISDDIPKAQAFEIGLMSNNELVLLCYADNKKEITLINFTTKIRKSISFDWKGSPHKHFVFDKDIFHFATYPRNYHIAFVDGEIQISKTMEYSYTKLFKDKFEVNAELRLRNIHISNTLTNINRVYINAKGNLTINNHEYVIVQGNQIKLIICGGFSSSVQEVTIQSNENVVFPVEAQMQSKDYFVFPNGYSVTVNRLGILILSYFDSTNNRDEKIFLPTVMDNQLGVASYIHFSGNTFYSRRTDFEGRQTMKEQDFWDKYITPFIKDIIDYEVNHRTISSK